MPTNLGKHYRADLTITAWNEDWQLADPPIVIKGFVPISFDETTDRFDPHFRAEILDLAVEGLRDFADRQLENPTKAWVEATQQQSVASDSVATQESTTNSNKKETA